VVAAAYSGEPVPGCLPFLNPGYASRGGLFGTPPQNPSRSLKVVSAKTPFFGVPGSVELKIVIPSFSDPIACSLGARLTLPSIMKPDAGLSMRATALAIALFKPRPQPLFRSSRSPKLRLKSGRTILP